MAIINDVLARFDELKSDRGTWENTWQEIVDYCLPNRAPIQYDSVPGEIRNETTVFDSTANKSVDRLAAALNSMLTNQSTEWFSLETDDPEVNRIPEVDKWLEETTRILQDSLSDSNFYSEISELYIDLCSIGTGTLYIEASDDPGKSLHFSARHIKEVYVGENHQGIVDTLYREFKMTAKQIIQKWGKKKVANEVKQAFEKFPEREFTIIHAVEPRVDRNTSKRDTANMPWASYWIDTDNKKMLGDSGYEVFPYVCPRWSKATGEKYGRSPALASLPDIKSLNVMVETMLKVGQKIADPPLNVPDENINPDLTPGGVNFYDPAMSGKVEPIVIGGNLPLNQEMITELRGSVRDAFYVTQLHLIDHRNMTAEEVRVRTDENLRAIGPIFGRLQTELIERLIARALNILQYEIRSDGDPMLPVPPEVVQGKNLRLKYLSPISKAQRFYDVQAIIEMVNTAAAWAQMNPAVLDTINFDEAVSILADLNGVPNSVMQDPKVVAAIRESRAQQEQQLLQLQAAEQQADVARKQADANKKNAESGGE